MFPETTSVKIEFVILLRLAAATKKEHRLLIDALAIQRIVCAIWKRLNYSAPFISVTNAATICASVRGVLAALYWSTACATALEMMVVPPPSDVAI
jgi:hypothetical protein